MSFTRNDLLKIYVPFVTSTDAVNNHKATFMIGDAELFLNITILVVRAAGVAALALDVDSTDAEKKRALDLK